MRRGDLLGDRFEIEQSIGTGGMSEVFRARDLSTGASVAVKVLFDQREHSAERFARESELLAELSHPGIVRYISHGVAPAGRPFLVMEWLDGEDLRTRLQRGPLATAETVALAARVAEALGVAHARGIVHRDLKPTNLFLLGGRIDQVKILDFGVAHREGRSQLTRTGTLIGTPGYMAPEQARNRGVSDARADVFALGCVLFHCLTGRPAFDGGSAAAVLAKILFEETPRVSTFQPEVPEDLDALIAQLMAKDPALRPSNGANLVSALAALRPVQQSVPTAPRDSPGKPSAVTGGERRLVSVVVLGGDAANAAADDAAAATAAEELARALQPYGGRLEQLADGSVIAVLEADREVATDHAAQAARCALAVRAHAPGRPMALAMGRIEPANRQPLSDVIDRAARLLARAARMVGEPAIALDEVSAGLLDARFDVVEREAALVLHGERTLLAGARTLLGRPTPCVGRDWELDALTGILEEAVEEREARAAIVTAPAGMGKSRLAAELVSRVRQRPEPIAIWGGRASSLRAGSTLDLIGQALRDGLGIHPSEPLADRQAKLRARVAEHVRQDDRRRVAEFLGELVDTPFPDDDEGGVSLRAARQDAQLMSEQMRRAWLDFLSAETAARPVLLVFDDLQWGDAGTVQFLDAALRELGQSSWMVVALARPEVFEQFPRLWADRQHVQQIRLKELGRKASERLVRLVLGDRATPETTERLITQADGNAFYLEELIRAVAEGKDHALPETVLAMVETRLARIPHEARRVLRAASVFGEVCWDGGVLELVAGDTSAAEVGERLARLIEQEVLVARPASRFPGERELLFRNTLLREGAYATLTDDDRRHAHRLAGAWLERHGETDPMVLARHAAHGGDSERAAGFYLRAAEQAFHIFDLEAAIARASLGLGCAPPPELRVVLLGIRCRASQGLQRVAMDDAEELVRTAPPGSIPWAQGMLTYHLGTMTAGKVEDLVASIALLPEVAPAPDAAGWMALLLLTRISILDLFGQTAQATALEEPFLALVQTTGERDPLARLWWNVAVAQRAAHTHDDPWRALRHAEAIHAILGEIGGERVFLNMELFRGMNLWHLGAQAHAVRVLKGIPTADKSLTMVSSLRRFCLAWLHADRGALVEARALAAQLAESGRVHRNRLEESRGRWALAEVLRRMGDFDGADRELASALAMAVPLDQPGVLGTLAALRLAQNRAHDALDASEDALARCAAMGGCGMFRGAFLRLTHAEAQNATGAHDASRKTLADARARLLATAARIGDRSYRQSFLEGVPENARTLALARVWLGAPEPTV